MPTHYSFSMSIICNFRSQRINCSSSCNCSLFVMLYNKWNIAENDAVWQYCVSVVSIEVIFQFLNYVSCAILSFLIQYTTGRHFHRFLQSLSLGFMCVCVHASVCVCVLVLLKIASSSVTYWWTVYCHFK